MTTDDTPSQKKETPGRTKKQTLGKKGLGWIPDYPDLRDYQLDKEDIQKEGRLTKEEGTSNLELLAESLILSLKKFQEVVGKKQIVSNNKELDTIIRDLESKVFGDVSFVGVKLRKILRPLPNAEDKHQRFFQSFPVLSYKEDNLAQQSSNELKTYLFILYNKSEADKFLKKPTDSSNTKLNKNIEDTFNDTQATFTWISKSKFDPLTTELLKRFQKSKKIPASGAIGMLTYNALSKCLKDEEELSGSLPEVQLISIPSLIPSQIVDTFLKGLIEVAAKKLSNEMTSGTEDKYYELSFFDKKFQCKNTTPGEELCKDYEGPSFERILRKTRDYLSTRKPYHSIIESLQEDRLQLFSGQQEASVNKREALILERSCKVFNNEFKVIEPLVSVILKLISPIAAFGYRDISEAIKEGFERFKALSEAPSKDQNSVTLTGVSDMPLLAMEALRKVRQELDEGLFLVTEEFMCLHADRAKLLSQSRELLSQLKKLEDEGKLTEEIITTKGIIEIITKEMQLVKDKLKGKLVILKATLYFYFLLQKFVKFYCERFTASYAKLFPEYINFYFPTGSNNPSSNQEEQAASIFDKREYLEVENSELLYKVSLPSDGDSNEDNNSENSQFELLPTENLQIPVLISLARIRGLNYLDNRTRAYLFLPGIVDLSFWCTSVKDQETIQSCTAIAGVALMEYFINRGKGKYTDLSSLFLYKVTRQKMNLNGDLGASLRETIKAMALFGVPPESAWEYDPTRVDEEPPQFCYSYAQNYQALKYFRLDYAGISREALLFQIKAVLAAGFPCMFGFTIYTSAYEDANAQEGWIPFPDAARDKVIGGHAVVAVGYDDYKLVRQADRKDYSQGAILIRNCWGVEWGKGGYGWIPYDYVRQGLTRDWWSLLKAEWFESGLLGVGSNDGGPKYPLY